MLRWLIRLLVLGLIVLVVARVVSRLLNREEDFDDFDDLESGLEFTETPVEIDVTAEEGVATAGLVDRGMEPSSGPGAATTVGASTEGLTPVPNEGAAQDSAVDMPASPGETEGEKSTHSLQEINGIGPTFASRLQGMGISTLEALAGADPEHVADQLEVVGGRSTVENWISQAQNLTSGGGRNGQASGG